MILNRGRKSSTSRSIVQPSQSWSSRAESACFEIRKPVFSVRKEHEHRQVAAPVDEFHGLVARGLQVPDPFVLVHQRRLHRTAALNWNASSRVAALGTAATHIPLKKIAFTTTRRDVGIQGACGDELSDPLVRFVFDPLIDARARRDSVAEIDELHGAAVVPGDQVEEFRQERRPILSPE